MKKILTTAEDLVRNTCNHMTDERYEFNHRAKVGVMIMVIGVGVSEALAMIPIGFAGFFGHTTGYLIHAIGAVPFIDHITKKGK